MVIVTPKIFNRLKRLADEQGRFFMLAIDQRGSVKKMLAKAMQCAPETVSHEAIAEVKKVITELLAPEATAVLIDSEYGFEGAWQAVPSQVGKLSTLEKSGGGTITMNHAIEERTVLLEEWSVAQAAQQGADAVKLLVPYHPNASEQTRKYQQSLVKQIGVECAEYKLPYLVEFTSYPISTTIDELKDQRLYIVAEIVQTFDQPDFGITIHKVEFPGDIDRHSQQQLIEACGKITAAVTKPWVLLSAGVSFDVFEKEVALACSHGASGFLAGRAIWQEAVALYDQNDQEQTKMREWLSDVGIGRMKKLKEAAKNATPFGKKLSI